MRLPFFEAFNTRRSSTALGFTLLELMLVLGLLAVVAALVAPSMGRSAGQLQRETIARAILKECMLARVEAMRDATSRSVELVAVPEGGVQIRVLEHTQEVLTNFVSGPLVQLVVNESEPIDHVQIRFASDGRTSVRHLACIDDRKGGTMFALWFDPLSGAPGVDAKATQEYADR